MQRQPIWGQHSKPGLSMVLVESTSNYNLFKFQHNLAYQQAQFKFLEAVDSMNPDNILVSLKCGFGDIFSDFGERLQSSFINNLFLAFFSQSQPVYCLDK